MNKWIGLLLVFWLAGCEKNIEFDLDEAPQVLVVDASIESNKAPVVVLTKSFSYYSTISPELLAASFVRNAEVYVSNGTLTHRLKEYSLPLIPGLQAYYYSIDSANLATAFLGSFNSSYSLKIIAEGKEYTSSTNIPALTSTPDSFFFKQAPQNPDTNKRIMLIRAFDPPGLGNYVRYFTKRNAQPFLPGENSVYNDDVLDGTSYEAQLPQGIDRNDPPDEEDQFYLKGDTVTLKFCNIDRGSYQFWNTWEFSFQSIGNPFAQPNKVLGNISNGALGAFCGYAVWEQTKIVN